MRKRSAQEKRACRKLKLWNQQHGLCHWCNCEMIHWTDSRYSTKRTVHRNRIATVDHLRDRYDPTRGDPNPDREQRWVLACWECNQRRSDERTAARPIEDLWRRSGRTPRRVIQNVGQTDLTCDDSYHRFDTRNLARQRNSGGCHVTASPARTPVGTYAAVDGLTRGQIDAIQIRFVYRARRNCLLPVGGRTIFEASTTEAFHARYEMD